jgi:hypothetical protein
MFELSYADYIAYCYAKDFSLTCALIAHRVLAPSEIAAAYRETAKDMEYDRIRPLLFSFADKMDSLESRMKNGAAPLWTPEVIPGGKDDDENGG